VRVLAEYYVSTTSSIAHLHAGLQTDNGGTNCAVQQHSGEPTARTVVAFDFTSCKGWTPSDFNGNVIRVEVGAHRGNSNAAVTFYLDYVKIEVRYTSASPGKSLFAHDTFYGYDAGDNLATIKNGTAAIYRQFDAMRRMKAEYFAMPDTCPTSCVSNLSLAYSYDDAGRILEIQYQDSSTKAFYAYDSLSRLVSVGFGNANNKQADITYDAAGRVDYIHYYEDGTDLLYEDYSYDLRDRVKQIRVFRGTQDYLKLDYTYNPASDVTHIDDNAGSGVKTHDYSYDGNGRLRKAVGPWGQNEGPLTMTYTYDAVGNILTKVDSGTTTYDYDPAGWNKLRSTTPSGGSATSYAYNNAGSVTRKDLPSGTDPAYTYDYDQSLVKIVDASGTHTYDYDGVGRRLKTTEPGGVVRYFVYSGSQMMGYKEGTTHTFFVYIGSELLMRKTGTTDNRYYFQDLSQNTRLVLYYTTSVRTEFKARYKPFGELVALTDATTTFKFASEQIDASGLYHMGARYYDPGLGRFLSRDPIGSGYSYGRNDPIGQGDPSGLVSIYWSNGAYITHRRAEAGLFQPLLDLFQPVLDWWNRLPPEWRWATIIVVDVALIVGTFGLGTPVAAGLTALALLSSVAVGLVFVAMAQAQGVTDQAALIDAFVTGFDIGAFAATTIAWGVKAVKGLSVVGRDLERGFASPPRTRPVAEADDVLRAGTGSGSALSARAGASAADGGEDLFAIARSFRATTIEGRVVTWPERLVDKMLQLGGQGKNRFRQIIDVWGGNERGVFGLTKSVLESVPGRIGRNPGTYEYILEAGGRGFRAVISGRTSELITVIPYYL